MPKIPIDNHEDFEGWMKDVRERFDTEKTDYFKAADSKTLINHVHKNLKEINLILDILTLSENKNEI